MPDTKTDNRLRRLLDEKARACKTEAEGADFDKLVLGSLACVCPDHFWDSALDCAAIGISTMRATGGNARVALENMIHKSEGN